MRTIGVILIVASLVSLSMSVYGLTTSFILENYGSVAQVLVYSDDLYVNRTSKIDWGTLLPGWVNTTTIYIENVGNKDLTLIMTATNWTSSNSSVNTSDYMSFDWTGDSVLTAGAKRPYILTLTIHKNVTTAGIGWFKFYIIIDGTSA